MCINLYKQLGTYLRTSWLESQGHENDSLSFPLFSLTKSQNYGTWNGGQLKRISFTVTNLSNTAIKCNAALAVYLLFFGSILPYNTQ